jgi:hypothetical protein
VTTKGVGWAFGEACDLVAPPLNLVLYMYLRIFAYTSNTLIASFEYMELILVSGTLKNFWFLLRSCLSIDRAICNWMYVKCLILTNPLLFLLLLEPNVIRLTPLDRGDEGGYGSTWNGVRLVMGIIIFWIPIESRTVHVFQDICIFGRICKDTTWGDQERKCVLSRFIDLSRTGNNFVFTSGTRLIQQTSMSISGDVQRHRMEDVV